MEQAGKRLAHAGAVVEELVIQDRFDGLRAAHAAISHREAGIAFLPEYVNAHALLAQELKDKVANTNGISDRALLESYALADACRVTFDALYGESLDVILTPSAPGEAPEGLHTTGNAVFNQMWTLLHVPCVNVPAGRGSRGLPLGVQLVGPRMSDARLLAIATALDPVIDTEPDAALRELW